MAREKILQAAAEIFSQKGYHGTSMQEIADAVNLQKASIYHHISSKQKILLALLDQALDLLIERIQAVVAQPLPPEEKLRQAMQVYFQTILENRELAVVLLLEHRSLEPDLHARHVPRRDRFEGLWREMILEGMEKGMYCQTDSALAGRALLGIMNWTVTWYQPSGALAPVQIAEQCADLFLNGMLIRSRQPGAE